MNKLTPIILLSAALSCATTLPQKMQKTETVTESSPTAEELQKIREGVMEEIEDEIMTRCVDTGYALEQTEVIAQYLYDKKRAPSPEELRTYIAEQTAKFIKKSNLGASFALRVMPSTDYQSKCALEYGKRYSPEDIQDKTKRHTYIVIRGRK